MENKAPAKEAPVKKERKKVNIVQIIIWAAILIVFLLCQKQIYGGLAAGAVKG